MAKKASGLRFQPSGGVRAPQVPLGKKQQLIIERLANDGRGIAFAQGRTWFVSGALAGHLANAMESLRSEALLREAAVSEERAMLAHEIWLGQRLAGQKRRGLSSNPLVRLRQPESHLVFQVISVRHDRRKPTVVTTNRTFGEWNQIFADDAVAQPVDQRRLSQRRHDRRAQVAVA